MAQKTLQDSWLAPVDIYCERLDPGFWAEPVNALTNLGFLMAAGCAWRFARRQGVADALEARLLIALIATIGVGSFLFHTLAVRWTALADVIPIFAFQLLFLAFYLRRVAQLRVLLVLLGLAAFVAVSFGFGALPGRWLNGSLSYAAPALFIAGLGVYHWRSQKQAAWALMAASAVFVVSLGFRSVDMAVCAHLSLGTHLMWHLLNSAVLYLCTRGLVANLPSAKNRASRAP